MSNYEQTRELIIKTVSPDFVTDVDGSVMWEPENNSCWPAHALRVIANELDRVNAAPPAKGVAR